MVQKPDIAVIIPTFNRADMLAAAIESVLDQDAEGLAYELVIVDNNSSDETRAVVDGFVGSGQNIRYLFEPKQGASNARNLGIVKTSADIIAFLDDDVRARPDWLSLIKQAFDKNPGISFVGGKVLPAWNEEPPGWLTPQHWPPLALIDYGDDEFVVNPDRQVCLVTANLAVRRTAFDRAGLFSPEFMRCEDHELEARFLRAGIEGLYVPALVVEADVQRERLSKKHHRGWYAEHGRTLALMRAYHGPHDAASDGRHRGVKLFDTPAHVYRQLISSLFACVRSTITRDESAAFYYELQARDFFNYIREIRERSALGRSDSRYGEAISFAGDFEHERVSKSENRLNG
jgi:glycosyltransferase involved in cell wall biosynthesis